MLIEQAVFTSARTDRSAGYQLVGRSPGVKDQDARELAAWGPSHDSLWDTTPGAGSVNFFRLPSGAYCVSKTSAEGQEYSARGGQQVYTQCLVVPPGTFLRFANNPFALLKAALAQGSLRVCEAASESLEPFALVGRASAVDQTLLARLTTRLGPLRLASLVQAALSADALAIAAGAESQNLVAGLLNCLPPECRTEFSFSTGLRFSSCRPFRVVGLPEDDTEIRQALRRRDLCVFNPSADPPQESVLPDGWPELLFAVLSGGKISQFAARLSEPHPGLKTADLAQWGNQWLAELARTCDAPGDRWKPADATSPSPLPVDEVSLRAPARDEERQRADAPHSRFERSARATAEVQRQTSPAELLSRRLPSDSPQVSEQLEVLDGVVFDAIAGSAAALEQLKTLWPVVLDEVGEDLVAESREQYLQYALRLWSDYADSDGVPDPTRAVAALDVLCLMFNEE
ncbi:MAG: GAP1-N2 domain-containing protein [Pirellulales bacterium]